ncbi:diguanylate cyclase with PAS/PAC and GAF sensors [Candidatus Vecturithrix granuli]|uniref:Diguanylate cyclase with PAS/PAC and GAF sensors n=1 Tax=Vecturithrix granuli TaxID=1499967 RepID=A0A0S6W9S7_VECG1|nr:diguanylate cyclase with PAS/PAC and GAF sensors [Candidatus Vecturithrix granuli]
MQSQVYVAIQCHALLNFSVFEKVIMTFEGNLAAPKGNILAVDDVHANLHLLTEILTQHGHTVRPVPDGRLAVTSAKAAPPDLILLDIMMPGLSGYEVCKQLKADEHTRDIPIIFISALNQVFDKVKAFSIGGVDYVTKPFHPDEVLARVNAHLAIRHLQKQLQEQNIQLQQEIFERKRAQESLQQRNRELTLLNQMNAMLQACHNEPETYHVLRNICEQLFPSEGGCLYMLHENPTALELIDCWNTSSTPQASISTDYQQVQHGEMYQIDSPMHPLYLYLDASLDNGCPYPMRDATGQILGILLLYSQPPISATSDEEYMYLIETKQLLISRVVEQYTLSLVNLRLREALKHEAIRDPLTGLFNRRYMEESLRQEIRRAKRNGSHVGLIMLDVDHFKQFNDTHGHETGDIVLQTLAKLLQEHIREGDIACRYGGEEFLLILPDASLTTSEQRAKELLEQVRKLRIVHQGTHFSITISLGVSTFPEYGRESQGLVNAADMAMYQAKKHGRNQVAVSAVPDETP